MKRSRLFSGIAAAALAITLSSAASAATNYGSKEANLQAMRWYAQQQMAKGLPNPYPGVDLWTGQGFSEFRKGVTNPYFANYGYTTPYYGYNNSYVNPYYSNTYGYNNTYVNPYYGNSSLYTNMYANPLYGSSGSYWY
jgi:hypothetical protein